MTHQQKDIDKKKDSRYQRQWIIHFVVFFRSVFRKIINALPQKYRCFFFKVIKSSLCYFLDKFQIIVKLGGIKMCLNCYCYPQIFDIPFDDFFYLFSEPELLDHEEPAFSFIKSILKKGMIVVDVGAASGFFSLKACSLVGNEGLVLSFEPDDERFKILEKNVMLNGFSNIRLHNLALDKDAKLTSFIETADIVLIDAEGFEYEILNGMGDMLLNQNISIMAEVHQILLSNEHHEEILNMLKDMNFLLYFARIGDNDFTDLYERIQDEDIYYLFATRSFIINQT